MVGNITVIFLLNPIFNPQFLNPQSSIISSSPLYLMCSAVNIALNPLFCAIIKTDRKATHSEEHAPNQGRNT